jgi:hypothetical protein
MSKTNLVRTSRDGDQFHYLWASRRCLRLLSAKNDLVAISIEGPSPGEGVDELSPAAGEEVIDIAEYFGSEEIRRARLVRYMQLKHSTLHATEPWTASGLEKTVKGFAKRYQELLQTFSADVLASKLEFWFITNRPISSDFAEAVADTAAVAAPRHPDELRKLERFTCLEAFQKVQPAFCMTALGMEHTGMHLAIGTGTRTHSFKSLMSLPQRAFAICLYPPRMPMRQTTCERSFTGYARRPR